MYLLNEKIKIDFPAGYQRLTNEDIECLFPGKQKPQEVMKGTKEVYMVFCLTSKKIDDRQLDLVRNDFCFMIRQRYPANIFFEKGEIDTVSGILSWVDFKGNILSGEIYYLLFLTGIEGKLLMGLFQCRWREMRIYRNQILHILSGITDVNKKNRE